MLLYLRKNNLVSKLYEIYIEFFPGAIEQLLFFYENYYI